MTSKDLQAKRAEKKYMKAAEEGKPEKVTEFDDWPIVVEKNFRNGPDDDTAHVKLIAYVMQHGSKALQAFLFKRRHVLPGLIDSIWQWETIGSSPEDACRSRVDTLRFAAQGPCRCGGRRLRRLIARAPTSPPSPRDCATGSCCDWSTLYN